jgi:hypothetical protein
MTVGNSADGRYVTATRIKDGAVAPDGVDKQAYANDDYETVNEWVDWTDDEKAAIASLDAAKQRPLDMMEAIAELYESMQGSTI